MAQMPREIGSLRALSNGESRFVGSASGVFFINTVRRAFTTAAFIAETRRPATGSLGQSSLNEPTLEDCIDGNEAHPEDSSHLGRSHGRTKRPEIETYFSCCKESIDGLRTLPNYALAKQLVMTYFQLWHPLLPFLHGPRCLDELEKLYVRGNVEDCESNCSLAQAIIFQCIFNVAILERSDLPPLGPSSIRSAAQLLPSLGFIALRSDLTSIQALLSAQLYFVATMSLRSAATVGGLIMRSITKSGLHRCPFRYPHLSSGDRDMRKRVFWSAYALDRFLSQSLGHPLGIHDSDFDVCPPGTRDLHEPVLPSDCSPAAIALEGASVHLPRNHPHRQRSELHPLEASEPQTEFDDEDCSSNTSIEGATNEQASNPGRMSQRRRENQSVLLHYVKYSRLIGRTLEIFHKSIHVRAADDRAILFLKADIDAWGNELPPKWLGGSVSHEGRQAPTGELPTYGSFRPEAFFSVAHQQLLLLVNRPSLSLETNSAEFRSGIQICIRAGKAIISTLEIHSRLGNSIFWPGAMSAVWMSGLVLAFACQLKLHSATRAKGEIAASLSILATMMKRWDMARHCHSVLSELLSDISDNKSPQNVQMDRRLDSPRHKIRSIVQDVDRGTERSTSEPASVSRAPKRRRVDSSSQNNSSLVNNGNLSAQQSGSHLPGSDLRFQEQPTTAHQNNAEIAYTQTHGVTHPHSYSTTREHTVPRDHHFQHSSMAQEVPRGITSSTNRQQDHYYSMLGNVSYELNPQSLASIYTIQPSQDQVPVATSFPFGRNGDWTSQQNLMADETFDASFDVFDGATWGSLLELIDNQG